MKYKMISFILIIAFTLAGCVPQEKPQRAKVTVWYWMVDRKDAFEALAKKYTEQSGVDIEFRLFFPPDIYSQKTIAAARAGNLPEIFGILDEKKTFASFIKAGHILNLNSDMEKGGGEWKNRFYPQTLAVVIFGKDNNYGVAQGVYGVPIDTTLMQFVYNTSLFAQAGIDPEDYPVTFDDFLNYAKKLKEDLGVDGFVCGWGEGWLLNSLATEWAINLMGEEKFLRTVKGEVPYTDPDWIEVFSLFAQLRGSGILASNIATMINKESEDAFAKGKAAFSFNGSWAVNVYKQLSPKLKYAFFSLPKISSRFPVKVWGGAGSSFVVNAHSPRKREAVRFLKWLSSEEQQEFLVRETSNLPAIKMSREKLPPILRPLQRDLNRLTHPNVWPYNEDSRVIEVIDRELQQIVMGLKDAKTAAEDIQSTKDRVSRK